ncbi:hypothetical protein QYE76_066420 [Lolium multiflorum]|uniref:Uncharacterized protein n=1 Tax=Lolium multiflorum TaxID=4521 RepID=A0AAD8SCV6_LOLMU|nr:hypothetical protein QYE76_066420 [Lolium multiflorum]
MAPPPLGREAMGSCGQIGWRRRRLEERRWVAAARLDGGAAVDFPAAPWRPHRLPALGGESGGLPAARAPQQHQVVDGAPATATQRRHAALHLALRRHLDGATAPDLVSMAQLTGIVGGGGELAGALHTSTAIGKSIAAMEIPQARPPRHTFSFPPNFLVAPPPAAARGAPDVFLVR